MKKREREKYTEKTSMIKAGENSETITECNISEKHYIFSHFSLLFFSTT